MEMDELIREYYENNAKKLYGMVDKILLKYGGITDKDDFYCVATDVFLESINHYDSEVGKFHAFFYSALSRRMTTVLRNKNTAKRSNTKKIIDDDGKVHYQFNSDISLDTPINNTDSGGTTTLEDIIADDFNTYEQVFGEKRSTKFDKYIETLPKKSRKVAELIGKGYKPSEIKEILHITEKQYTDAMFCIKSSEYISILY